MPFDLLLDDYNDLLFENGDLVIGESTRQHQKLLLLIEKGQLREFSTHGIGMVSWINDGATFANLKAVIKQEFERDGMKVSKVSINNTSITTEASYD